MLIEFSVSNYRSFREKQTFSMVAATKLRKRENVFTPQVDGEKLPDLLKIAAIYGPNASGKSNLLQAFAIVRQIAARLPSSTDNPLPVSPFRFDAQLQDQPSCFEIHFIAAGLRYQFELAVTRQRIIRECLIAYPKGKEALLYSRVYQDDGREHYEFGETLEGGGDLHEFWRKTTGPQILFLSQAVANSSDELMQLRKPFKWLQDGMRVCLQNVGIISSTSLQLVKDNANLATELCEFLQDIDVPVSTIKVNYPESAWSPLDTPKPPHLSNPELSLIHKTALGNAEFEFEEESVGTKNLFGFWGLWRVFQKSHLINVWQTLILDEIDSSLHPEIVAAIVAKHQAAAEPAQLIFTTHDTHLMDTKLLRRDQIWLTERDSNGATQLRAVHDFAGRESEDVEKRYYEGRYRALPLLRRG